jgi:hypothetical protein
MTALSASPSIRRRLSVLLVCLLSTFSAAAFAYVVTSYTDGDETLYLKWGDNHAGMPGGTVYWSFMPAGTPGSAYCADDCPGSSTDSHQYGNLPGRWLCSGDARFA